MDINAVIDGIQERRVEAGLTYQQVADASGVPKSTVNRILLKQTPNPSIKTLADLAAAVGYDLDPAKPAVMKDHTKDSYIIFLQESLAVKDRQHEKEKTQMEARHNRAIAEKNRTIKYLAIALIMTLSFLICWLIIDITHPTVGWIQREIENYYTHQSGPAAWDLLRSYIEHLFA